MPTKHRQFREGVVQLFCHRHVGQQHELLDQAVAVAGLEKLEALQHEEKAKLVLGKIFTHLATQQCKGTLTPNLPTPLPF
jgi:hypothetical protein